MQTLETREGEFYREAESWFHWSLEMSPVKATEMGEHRWDGRLGDFSLEALESQHGERLATLAQFQEMDTTEFGVDGLIDHVLIVQILKSEIRKYERVRPHHRDPGLCLKHALDGVTVLLIKEFAPLEERLVSVIDRIRETARVLDQSRANIVAKETPPVWCALAREQAKQALNLFTRLLPSMDLDIARGLRFDLDRLCSKAAEEIQAYSQFLKTEVMPKASGDFATGPELFNEILREDHLVEYRADALLETGWKVLHETRRQMQALAADIDPNKSAEVLIDESKSRHPTADGLLKAHEETIGAARRFVLEHRIATIPQGEALRVIETPVHMRTLVPFAAYLPPGILEDGEEGLYWVTPIDSDEPPEVREERLAMHNLGMLTAAAVHEGYPGHHLQLLWSNRSGSIPRKMGMEISTSFLEGWAFYCEELMERLGFSAEPSQRLIRLRNQLWRATRAILDASLHTGGMTVDEGVEFLAEECRMDRSSALAEVRRYTQSPTQPQSYLMGKLALMELMEDYRKQNPNTSLCALHDTILGCGSIPPALMRRRLLPGTSRGYRSE